MVYVFDDFSGITPELYDRAVALVPPYRREYAARYRFENDRIQSVFAFLLLQYGVAAEYNVKAELQLDYRGGKPVMANLERVHFNLSHCCLAVACAVSDSPVGADVQDWSARHLSVAKQVCTARELSFLDASQQPQVDFARLWTRKESYGKYTGQGILYPMRETELFQHSPQGTVLQSFTFDGYALSYCAEKALEIKKLTINDLFFREREK